MKTHILKKLSIIFILLISFESLFAAKKVVAPDWLLDVNNVYPFKDYIAQVGEGKSKEMAQNDAVGKIARYFESNVETSTQSFLSMSQKDNKKAAKSQAVEVVTKVSSDVKLFAVEYSESYYDKKAKTYYVVGFIKRENVWKQYEPTVEMSKNSFYSYYDKAQKEQDPFTKIEYLQDAWNNSSDFIIKLETARLISSDREARYDGDRKNIANINGDIAEIRKNLSFSVDVTGDYQNYISSELKNQMNKLGYRIADKSISDYKLVAKLYFNETQNEDLYIVNSVLSIDISGNYRELLNVEYKADESIANTLDYAKYFAAEDLKKVLSTEFYACMERINEYK